MQWLKNPISTKELIPAALGCGNAGGAPATPQQLAQLSQQTAPPAVDMPSEPAARDSGEGQSGGKQNAVKMPPMGVRIAMTVGGEVAAAGAGRACAAGGAGGEQEDWWRSHVHMD